MKLASRDAERAVAGGHTLHNDSDPFLLALGKRDEEAVDRSALPRGFPRASHARLPSRSVTMAAAGRLPSGVPDRLRRARYKRRRGGVAAFVQASTVSGAGAYRRIGRSSSLAAAAGGMSRSMCWQPRFQISWRDRNFLFMPALCEVSVLGLSSEPMRRPSRCRDREIMKPLARKRRSST